MKLSRAVSAPFFAIFAACSAAPVDPSPSNDSPRESASEPLSSAEAVSAAAQERLVPDSLSCPLRCPSGSSCVVTPEGKPTCCRGAAACCAAIGGDWELGHCF